MSGNLISHLIFVTFLGDIRPTEASRDLKGDYQEPSSGLKSICRFYYWDNRERRETDREGSRETERNIPTQTGAAKICLPLILEASTTVPSATGLLVVILK